MIITVLFATGVIFSSSVMAALLLLDIYYYGIHILGPSISTEHIGGGQWGILETAKPKKDSFKTANKIGQNRKPHAKLCTQIGPNRKKIGKTKNHTGYQNRKTAGIFYENWKPDAKKRKIRKPHWTPKPKNRSKKYSKPQNRKSQCPPHIGSNPHTTALMWLW